MNIKQVIEQLQKRSLGKYRLRPYVSDYLTRCLTFQKGATLITSWCLSKSLEVRLGLQGKFTPLPKEYKVLKDLNLCNELLSELGLQVSHFIFLVGSGVERGQVTAEVRGQYQDMLQELVDFFGFDILVDTRAVASPDLGILNKPEQLYHIDAYHKEIERRISLAKQRNQKITKTQAVDDAILSIAVKAGDAMELTRDFGDFLLIPIQFLERYQFHNLGYPNFTDRLLPITQFYPWRL